MNFFDQPASKQWAGLMYRGEKFAEVWFKPEGDPFALTFRILPKSSQLFGTGHPLTIERLLKVVGIAADAVESWSNGDVCHAGMGGSNPELKSCFAPLPQDAIHLEICVHLTPPSQPVAANESSEPVTPPSQPVADKESSEPATPSQDWQSLLARWKAILGIEASMDTLRISMESLQTEMENSLKKTLTFEEKTHAHRADVAVWTKAKSRVHNAIPKVKEFIHRSVWAIGAPERKQLAEIFKEDSQPQLSVAQRTKLLEQLEKLQKDRQVLSAHGVTVYQECKGLSANVQNALRSLQSSAVANAAAKKSAGKGGKFFKSVRKMSGA